MKLFEAVLTNFAFLGLQWEENSQKYFYTKNCINMLSLCLTCIVLTFLFLIHDAKSLVEYTEGLFIFTAALAYCIHFVSIYVNLNVLSDFTKNSRNLISLSKRNHNFKIVFEEAIEEVEKWSKIITFLSQKIIPICGVFSRLIPSYFLYFVIGLPSF